MGAPFLRTKWVALDEAEGKVATLPLEAQILLQNRRRNWEWTSFMLGDCTAVIPFEQNMQTIGLHKTQAQMDKSVKKYPVHM